METGGRVDAHHECRRQADLGAVGEKVVEDLVRRRSLQLLRSKRGSRGGRREDGGRRGLQRGEAWLEACGAPHSGEPIARDVDHAEDETGGVGGGTSLAGNLQRRDTEDLRRRGGPGLEYPELARLD